MAVTRKGDLPETIAEVRAEQEAEREFTGATAAERLAAAAAKREPAVNRRSGVDRRVKTVARFSSDGVLLNPEEVRVASDGTVTGL